MICDCCYFGLPIFVAGAIHEAEGCFFTGFDGWLVVGVDLEEEACVSGCYFPELDELADGVFVYFGEFDGEVGTVAFDECVFGCAFFCIEEGAERFVFEVLEIGDVEAFGDGEVIIEVFDLKEADDFVVGSLAVELDL